MPPSSQARWGQFAGICALFLLAEGLSHGVNGLLKLVKSEAYLRGSDAVILLDPKVWAEIAGHRTPSGMAQALIPQQKAAARSRADDGRRPARRTKSGTTADSRPRVRAVASRGSAGARARIGRPRLSSHATRG